MEINYNEWSDDQITQEIKKLEQLSKNYKNEEQGVKLTLNSIYGAVGNQYFALFNLEVAEAVTMQGKDLWKYAEKIINNYFQKYWHLDQEIHEIIGCKNVKPVTTDMVIYGDTDSVFSHTLLDIYTNKYNSIMIGELFEDLMRTYKIQRDISGNEIIMNPDFKVLNYKENLIYSPVKKLIRHRVRKSKWKLTTESGKEVIVTNDHSLTIIRDGKKITVKPSEVNIQTDSVIEIIDY